MKKIILGSIFGLLFALPSTGMSVAVQDDVTVADEASARFTELSERADQAYKGWITDIRKRMAEAEAAGEELPEEAFVSPLGEFVPQFVEAAADYAGSEDAVPFLVWIAQRGMQADQEAGKRALITLFDKHTRSEGLAPLANMLGNLSYYFDDERTKAILLELEAESPVPALRGWAGYARLEKVLENAAIDSAEFKAAKEEMLGIAEEVSDKSLSAEVKSKLAVREKFSIGMVAPDIIGKDLDGTEFKLSDYKGKVLFVDFWGDW